MRRALIALALLLPAIATAQLTATSHRPYLGRVQEGMSLRVTASIFDSSPTPVPVLPDVVDCWVWSKGVDPSVTPPLYTCPTVIAPGIADVPLDLSPLATQIVDPDMTSTERHYIKVLAQAAGKYIPLEGEFDVISDPGIVVDPTSGVPGPVLPPTPTATPGP